MKRRELLKLIGAIPFVGLVDPEPDVIHGATRRSKTLCSCELCKIRKGCVVDSIGDWKEYNEYTNKFWQYYKSGKLPIMSSPFFCNADLYNGTYMTMLSPVTTAWFIVEDQKYKIGYWHVDCIEKLI